MGKADRRYSQKMRRRNRRSKLKERLKRRRAPGKTEESSKA